MNPLEKDLERIGIDLAAVEADLARLNARAEGLRAERDALARAIASPESSAESLTSEIADMVKADAIVTVLRNAKPQPLRAAGIVEALHKGGRTNEVAAHISVYLDSLLKQGRVIRVSRGEYTAPD
ncbi:hypothetical protein [Alloactinosynnema sp. L-07]|uniref:hypothetical protein n=1 Tax=Alloactinosynnema sp. L-07 TaxID=1653480 RepID=UPI00065EF5E8|nr:hypothetical protein [Alloactinosynnema sp. L-07]CRK56009.1 hypothetical protein [Alloactinosynnema sp. L-07]